MHHFKSKILLWSTLLISTFSLQAEKLDTILVIGQSNAVGRRTKLADLDKRYHYLKDVTHFAHKNAQAGRDLPKIPFDCEGQWTQGLKAESDYIGPEFGFSWEWTRKHKKPLGLIKFTCGATNLHAQWAPSDNAEKSLTQRCIQLVKQAQSQKDIRIIAIFWNQGENDSLSKKHAEAYEDNLKQLIKTLRHELKLQDTPFIAARINPSPRYIHAKTVREAIEMKYSNYSWIELPHGFRSGSV